MNTFVAGLAILFIAALFALGLVEINGKCVNMLQDMERSHRESFKVQEEFFR